MIDLMKLFEPALELGVWSFKDLETQLTAFGQAIFAIAKLLAKVLNSPI